MSLKQEEFNFNAEIIMGTARLSGEDEKDLKIKQARLSTIMELIDIHSAYGFELGSLADMQRAVNDGDLDVISNISNLEPLDETRIKNLLILLELKESEINQIYELIDAKKKENDEDKDAIQLARLKEDILKNSIRMIRDVGKAAKANA